MVKPNLLYKQMLNKYVLNFCTLPQKLKHLVYLVSKTTKLTKKKLDHIFPQNLIDKQASDKDNHHLNIINYLFHRQALFFANLFCKPFVFCKPLTFCSFLFICCLLRAMSRRFFPGNSFS